MPRSCRTDITSCAALVNPSNGVDLATRSLEISSQHFDSVRKSVDLAPQSLDSVRQSLDLVWKSLDLAAHSLDSVTRSLDLVRRSLDSVSPWPASSSRTLQSHSQTGRSVHSQRASVVEETHPATPANIELDGQSLSSRHWSCAVWQ